MGICEVFVWHFPSAVPGAAATRLQESRGRSPAIIDAIACYHLLLFSRNYIFEEMGAPNTASKSERKKPSVPTSAATYVSLIQQYLAVFQVENALWLAERCVAAYPENTEAVYLQALCYYRAGKVKNARAVLERQTAPTSSMQYLIAQCCYDLGEYSWGEIVMMKETRVAYKQSRETNGASLDDWILQTTVR